LKPEQARLLNTVEFHLQEGRPDEARKILSHVEDALADSPRVWWAKATLARMTGDRSGAEAALKRTAELDPDAPFAHTALGDVYFEDGKTEEAFGAWRLALGRDPTFVPAALHLAEALVMQGDATSALPYLDRAAAARPDPGVFTMRANVNAALGRREAMISDYRAAVTASKGAIVALKNLSMALLGEGQLAEAASVLQRAIDNSPRDPDLWQLMGRVRQAENDLATAQTAFETALEQDDLHPGAQRDLAHLIWARTGNYEAAAKRLDAALASSPEARPLLVVKAKLLEYADRAEEARDLLTQAAEADDAPNYILCAASQALTGTDRLKAATFAATAVARAPTDVFGLAVLTEAQLAAGDIDGAELTAARIRSLAPDNQHGVALQATAWRLKGDARYGDLADYDQLVASTVIETPEGWSSLPAFLTDLKAALETLHSASAHPIGQSLRGGTQTNVRLELSDDPAIKAFFKSVDAPIRAYIAGLGAGDDPLRSRIKGQDYRLSGAWSVRLTPGGRHVDHLHDQGWISSAFYVDLPPAVLEGDGQGELRFGQPGTPTRPALEAEHRVQPRPGVLALFPSYMWHGTEPFDGDQPRLTIAFDIAPGA
jgi:tetratricopeptide (TPR) repeat protein